MRRSVMELLADPTVRRRAGRALVAFTIGVALLVTLYPFRFHLRGASLSRVDWKIYYPGHNNRDLIQNLLMLMPLGVGLALARYGVASLRRLLVEAAALGFGLATMIETLQIFDRGRYPQLADVWRNGLGCVVGAAGAYLAINALLASYRRRRQASPPACPAA